MILDLETLRKAAGRLLLAFFPKRAVRALCRQVGRWTGRGSRLCGPPRGFYNRVADWLRAPGRGQAEVLSGRPAVAMTRTAPFHLDSPLHEGFQKEMEHAGQPTFVLRLHGGRVWGSEGTVITPDDHVLTELSPEFQPSVSAYNVFRQIYLGPVRPLGGTTALLAAPAGNVYGHWMMDVLPRLGVLEDAGFAAVGIDHFYVNSLTRPFQTESLGLLGIPPERRVDGSVVRHVRADTLLAPSLPGNSGNMPAWAAAWLRSRFLPCARNPGLGRRIWISRGKAERRQVLNEGSLVERLRAEGVAPVCLEDLTFAEQIGLFAAADLIIGPNGSGMFNILFCRPGTITIELFSASSVNVCQWAIGQHAQVRYGYLLGEPEPRDDVHPHEWNYRIEPEKLLKLIGLAVCQ